MWFVISFRPARGRPIFGQTLFLSDDYNDNNEKDDVTLAHKKKQYGYSSSDI